ncbi:hypothetical protein GJAV_G00051250 [Gymnothorax javanicus]|nr:hypothetical protein GJAV_G00051250 [Gymnothorax javanicus]
MILLTIKHSQQLSELIDLKGELESSFEWQRLMKYHLTVDDCGPCSLTEGPGAQDFTEASCYVDILNSQLSYSYEYLSPECWTMVRTVSSDQAVLGTLLALICYRGGFIAGPRMSGKTETMAHLGQALGRTVITMHCYIETSADVILRMLMGALQTGAWLLLDCADSMPQGVLSVLGQHLSDIHRCFSLLLSHRQPQPGQFETQQELKIMPTTKGSIEPGLQVKLGGKTVTAKLGYGCILFSSSRRVAEIPENLRGATRPVYLVQPDYGVIAEATLAASGFSEAASMSRRLVSLLNLAKDSACLPKSICSGQSSWLVLLHRVLTFAGIYLNRSMRVEWEKDRMADSDHEARRQLLNMVLRAPEGLGYGPKSTCRGKFRRANQCVVVMQTIAEEQVIIKAVTSAVASSIIEPGKARHFVTIFGEIFPGARCPPYRLQGREEMQEAALKAAVVEELHEAGLQPNSCVLSTVLALFQTLRLSRAVVLLGLTGSGKTICYRALVGALKRLASREVKEDGREALSPSLTWSSVDVSVIFPNAVSIDELWGGFNGPLGCWQDGIIAKALRESQALSCTASPTTGSSVPESAQQSRRQVERVHSTRWLVLDGEPLGCASWLDPLYTLCDPKNPLLCLPTGEKLQPPREELKVLIEATDLSDASPAALARCGLVHHSAEELWRAVWRTQLLALNKDPTLEQSCLTVWSRLADDLFPRTLAFLRERRLASVLAEHDASAREVTHGVQEVMSFSRVLCSLKEQFGRSKLKSVVKHTDKSEGPTYSPQTGVVDLAAPLTQQELQARNVFVVAYVWGFGGHLHPRHWPQFDEFARSALYGSRYRVVVPAEASVFECLFHLNDGPAVVSHSQVQNRSLQASCSTIPQYERHLFLLRLMAKARQPALAVGEVGSGKTTLCYSAIGAKLPHLHLPVGALLKPAHLRALLAGVACPSVRSGAMTTVARQPRLLLFLDDLHDAPCDVFGKASMALETLRQCMSTGSVVTTNGRHFRLCSSGVLSFIASSALSCDGMSSCRAISPRLSRLFSILTLPNLSQELLFSIHSPRLQLWISELPLVADMATCILTATLDLYHAVRQAFPPRFDQPHLLFSPHDLRKVFQGMCLWRPPWDGDPRYWALHKSTGPPSLSVVRLWAHECMRTFGDRLGSDEDRGELVSLLTQVSHSNFAERLASELKVANKGRETDTPSQSTNSEPKTGEEGASTREESSGSSTEEEEDEDHTESEEADHSTSCVSVSLSERVELSDVLSEEPDLESVNYSGAADGDNGRITSQDTLSETSRTTPALSLSPPKDSRPQSKLERASSNGSGKLVIRLPQCTSADQAVSAGQSPVSTSMVMEMLGNLTAYLQDAVFFLDVSRSPPHRARPLSCKRSAAYKEQELEELLKQLATVMKLEKEEARQEKGRYVTSYGVHRQGVRQLASALRALLLPGGHGVLFGSERGTGRKTTVRLAAQLLGYQLLEVHSGNEAALWVMLKEASASVGLRREGLVLLVHGNVSQVVRDELLVAMANRNFPRLYSYKEWKLDRPSKGLKGHEEHCMTERYFRQVPWNVHVFLLMPLTPGVQGPGTGGFISRALSLSSCVEVYQLWDKEALAEVATHYLKRNLHPPHLLTGADGTCLAPSLSNAMSWIHQSARRYTSVLTPDLQPFSTQNYIEFLSHFLYLCAHLYNEGRSQANRLAAILSRMKEMTDQADQYYREVYSLSRELSAAQQWQAKVQCDVDSCRSACERARQRCLLEETRLAQLEEQLQQARQLSHDALQQVSPLYQAALEAMRSLSQSDLEELRRYRRPPEGVMGVLDVICVLFARPCTWESCQQLLGSPNFLQELEFYDRSALCWEMFGVLSEAVRRPGFQPEAVREVSRACESLCRWVRAVHQYACAVRRMAPHEARRAQLEAQAAETRTRLRDARLQEEEARVQLEQAERRLQEARSATEELAVRLHLAQTRERDAAAAVQQVAPHMASWRALAEETERGIGTIPGDALILAAALAYLGRFGPDVRSELLGKWRDLCVTGHMETDPADPRTAHLPAPPSPPPLNPPHVPVPLGESLQAPIARLLGGVRGVAPGVPPPLLLKLLLWGYRSPTAQRCPLLANTEQRDETVASLLPGQLTEGVAQANEFNLVVSADDPTLQDKLKEGSEKGLTVLVTHVERARPTPEFLGLLGRPAQSPTLNRPVSCPPAAPLGFHVFLSTPLPIRALQQEIHPSVLAEAQAVDFSLSGAELQEVMLAEMMQSKCPQIWSQNCQARTEKQMLLEKLHQQEVSLMDYVLQTSTPLLQDPHFLPRVSACQTSILCLQEEVQELDQDMERHSPLLARFHVEAGLVADFYQALQDVARLSSLYLFPLRCYLPALREGLALQETPDLTFGGDEGMGEVSAEVLLAHLMVHFRPCLFQSHANVLRLLVSAAVSRHGEGCSEAERVAFLRGLGDEDFPGLIQSVPVPPTQPSQLPDWLPASAQREVLRLESLPSFRGLTASLTSDSEQWAEYLRYPSSTVIGPVPCPSHSHLSILQRALLWKTLLPHWLAAMADDFAACQLGKPFQTPLASNPHPGTPEALSQIVERAKGPIVLILPEPGEAAPPAIHPLSLLEQTAQSLTEDNRVKTVQVVTFGAECQREMVMKALDSAVQEGHWLVFDNCHLLNQWDDEVVCRLTQLVSGTNEGHVTDWEGGGCGKIQGHPDFRLWFITRANAPLSIPAAMRSFALRLACDSPWDLREVLRCSLRQLSGASVAMKPMWRCVTLHAVLLQRRAYRHLGQARMYCWTQEDLQALLDAQVRISSHCNDPVGTLEYIAGALVYGGHVEDPADLEAVKGVARACLRPPPPLWGRGPHTLAELIASSRFGQRPLQQAVEGCIQGCAPSTDPLLLGLSSGLEGELVRMRSQTLHLLLRDTQTPGASPPALALPPLPQVQDRLRALGDMLGRGGTSRATPQTPLGLFLQQEWDSLVQAVASMHASLTEPGKNCAPRPTLCTLSRLEARARLLGAYLWKEAPETPPYAYRLSAFANPRGFLAALLREGARGEQGDMSRLSLHFQVLSAGTVPSSLPSHGMYLCGLELQEALWDTRLNALQDTLSPKPCPLPPVWVTAQSRLRKMPPGGGSTSLPLYQCPLYLDGEFGDGDIIIRIPLAAKLDPVLCALRPVRLVSSL